MLVEYGPVITALIHTDGQLTLAGRHAPGRVTKFGWREPLSVAAEPPAPTPNAQMMTPVLE